MILKKVILITALSRVLRSMICPMSGSVPSAVWEKINLKRFNQKGGIAMITQNIKKLWAGICMIMVTGCAQQITAESLKAQANVMNRQGENVGKVVFEQTDQGAMAVRVELHSFKTGTHALHIHEHAACEPPDFNSAGGHFNPFGTEHGFLNTQGHHAGDLPNITVDEDGTCSMSFVTNQITLRKNRKNAIIGGQGRSVVIHENPDDYFTDPAGRGGKRIGCGLIKPVE
ncbi:MAG: superoxide dismutase family protein [Elusimicrobia bacterium]|nr:superoxide dismutase family protein [Elusimicrobiota bacterium]MBD3412337.1 superoxide dismutase family protein [Elusimicrobiota bacterium]